MPWLALFWRRHGHAFAFAGGFTLTEGHFSLAPGWLGACRISCKRGCAGMPRLCYRYLPSLALSCGPCWLLLHGCSRVDISAQWRVGPVFQGRYEAILVERDNYLLELARHVVLNPVRAGMQE